MKIKCAKHGEVEAYINKNNDAFCPECYNESLIKLIKSMSEEEFEDLSEKAKKVVHKSISMGCTVEKYKCPICNKDWKD